MRHFPWEQVQILHDTISMATTTVIYILQLRFIYHACLFSSRELSTMARLAQKTKQKIQWAYVGVVEDERLWWLDLWMQWVAPAPHAPSASALPGKFPSRHDHPRRRSSSRDASLRLREQKRMTPYGRRRRPRNRRGSDEQKEFFEPEQQRQKKFNEYVLIVFQIHVQFH